MRQQEERLIKRKMQGCKFHFHQSIIRVKKLLNEQQKRILNQCVKAIENIYSIIIKGEDKKK